MKERPHCGNKAMRRSLSMHYKEVNSFRCRTTLLPTEFIFRNFEPSLSHDPFPSSTDTMSLNRQRSNCLDTQSHEDRKPVICSGQCKIFDRAVLVYTYIYIWWRPATPPSNPHAAQQSNAIYMIPLCRVHYLYTPHPSHRGPWAGSKLHPTYTLLYSQSITAHTVPLYII